MRKFGILGHPLGHTMSPPIHRRLFQLSGHEGDCYDVYDVPQEELPARMAQLKALAGFNVTIPHKVELLSAMDRLDETALRYGALNVVALENGLHVGYNTDCYGFCKTVEMLGADLTRSVCVLGAGGVGRMFAIESALKGAAVTIGVRPNALELAQRVRGEILAQRPDAAVAVEEIGALKGPYHLLINATPAGMYPKTDGIAVEPALLKRCEYVFDSVYNPTVTRLMAEAEQAGCRVAGGMAMLVWQAVKAHEIWDGAVYEAGDIAGLISQMAGLVDQKFGL